MHRIWADITSRSPGDLVPIDPDEAQHALKVKRLGPADEIELLSGEGVIARATIVEPESATPQESRHGKRSRTAEQLWVRLDAVRSVPPTTPRVHVHCATPKGQRVDELIDQLSQSGAASWTPLVCARSIVEPRAHKLERLERIAREACKQCGRAWTLAIHPSISLTSALSAAAHARMHLVIADASGSPWEALSNDRAESPQVALFIGPEGGFTPEELAMAQAAGARVARFGPHVMRIETAAVVATGILLSHSTERRLPAQPGIGQ